jgi:hypothetical protein
MLLRRITKHVKDQNWFAVGIDFIIVVVGVFIGIQVANWNTAQADKREYQRAIARVVAGAKGNLAILDSFDEGVRLRLTEAEEGLAALRTCEDTDQNEDTVVRGVNAITGTSTIHVQTSALDEMATTAALLAQQDLQTRSIIAQTRFRLRVLKTEADFAEALPFRDRPELSPALTVGTLQMRNYEYFGIPISRKILPLDLAVPVSEACGDDLLLKSFYTWKRSQNSIPAYAASMRSEFNNLLVHLQPEHEVEP